MKLKQLFISSLLAVAVSTPALAKQESVSELATPVITLMSSLKEIRADLNLDEKQSQTIDAWLASAPDKRKELQQNALAVRAELRTAVLNRDSRVKRDELKVKLNKANSRLIELSSLCARMLNKTLSAEQYAKVVAHYKMAN